MNSVIRPSAARGALALVLACACGASVARGAVQYGYDDGTGSVNIGPSFLGPMLWGNYFYTQSVGSVTQDTITQVSVAFGNIAVGRSVTLCVFEDVDADGNPANAVLRATTSGLTDLPRTNTYINYNVSPTKITSGAFFVAALVDIISTSTGSTGDRPGRLDPQTNSGRSWYFADSVMNLNNIGGSPISLNMANNFIPGTWMVRATAIPGPATGALLGLTAIGAGLRRRRRG